MKNYRPPADNYTLVWIPAMVPSRQWWCFNLLRLFPSSRCEHKLWWESPTIRRKKQEGKERKQEGKKERKNRGHLVTTVYLSVFESWMHTQWDSLRWFSQHCSRIPHFGGVRTPGLWPPTSNSAEIFVQWTYPQVSSSYVYSFGSYRVDKQTHKQIRLKTSNVLCYATTSGNRLRNTYM